MTSFRTCVVAAASLLVWGCTGSVETVPGGSGGTTSTGTGGSGGATTVGTGGSGGATTVGTGGLGGSGGGPIASASCAEAKVLWSVPSEVQWKALAVAPDGAVYLFAYGGLLEKRGPDGALLWQTQTTDDGAYRISAGPGGRVLIGPGQGTPAYRAYHEDSAGMPSPLWVLGAESLGLTPGIWGTRGAVTGEGQFVIAGVSGGSLSLVALGDMASPLWKAAEGSAEPSGWALAAANGTGVVTFEAGQKAVTRWTSGGSIMWSTAHDPETVGVDDIAVAPGGDTYLLGVTDFPSDVPFSVSRISPQGKPLWTTTFPSNADESLSCGIAPLADGGAMVCVDFEHGILGLQRLSADGQPLWDPPSWFAADCGPIGMVEQIAGSPDGAVVMLTSTGVVKIAP